MKKLMQVLSMLLLFTGSASGQIEDFQSIVEKGIKLYDEHDYNGAIEQYKKALQLDKKSPLVHYEMSSTYFALAQYDKAIEYSDNVLDINTKYMDQAYILKGSAQDLLGKPKDAIKTYKKGIKEYPQNHLLFYNLAYTSYAIKEYKDSEDALQEALKIKPTHASSHMLLGIVMSEEGHRAKSLLSMYNFLLLEPTGKRAKTVYGLLEKQLQKGVQKTGENSTTITINSGESTDFSAAELMLSMLEASKSLEENKNKTEYELFSENTKSFFTVMGELKGKNKGFWWNYYVDFFYALTNEGHSDAFSYYILQSKEDEKVNTWLKDNEAKIKAFSTWYSAYERKL